MGKKSKFFRAFVEGQTISDNRVVTAQMIDDIVSTFNVETYTPGINIEHISGFSPEPPFNRYGDVIAVRAQVDDIVIDGKTEKRKALYAQVDALDPLVQLAEKGQKPFPSVELTPDYAGADKIGLVNIAFTDNPASIATQKLQFSRHAPGTVFASGTEGVELEFEADAVTGNSIADAVKQGFSALAAAFSTKAPEKPAQEPEKPANDNGFDVAAFSAKMGETIGAIIKPIADAQAQLATDFAALQSQLETTEQPQQFQRKPAAGGNASLATNC